MPFWAPQRTFYWTVHFFAVWRTFNNLKNLLCNGKILNGTINGNKEPLIFKSLQWSKIHLLKTYLISISTVCVSIQFSSWQPKNVHSKRVNGCDTRENTRPWPLAQAAQCSMWGCLIVLSPLALNKHSSSVRESQWPPIHAQVECLKNAWEERKKQLVASIEPFITPLQRLMAEEESEKERICRLLSAIVLPTCRLWAVWENTSRLHPKYCTSSKSKCTS